jgi:hypothetical protein
MRFNKLFELAATSALLLTQNPSVALAETSPVKETTPNVNFVEVSRITNYKS